MAVINAVTRDPKLKAVYKSAAVFVKSSILR